MSKIVYFKGPNVLRAAQQFMIALIVFNRVQCIDITFFVCECLIIMDS